MLIFLKYTQNEGHEEAKTRRRMPVSIPISLFVMQVSKHTDGSINAMDAQAMRLLKSALAIACSKTAKSAAVAVRECEY